MSEPHTSELNGGISLVYIYIYIYIVSAYVQCTRTRAAYGHYERDLIGNMCAAFIVRFYSQIFATCSEHVCSEYFQRALKPSNTRKTGYCAPENERESPTCGRNSRAKAEKINEAERDRARRSTQTADAYINILLCIYTLQTCTACSRSPHNAPHSPSIFCEHAGGETFRPVDIDCRWTKMWDTF